MKRELTAEQKAKRDERRAQFKALWQRVSKMPELERIQLANKYGLRTVEGHELSLCNQMLVVMQNPQATVLGGFRQWINQGRAVRKGEHGCMIWVPISGSRNADMGNGCGAESQVTSESVEKDETRFIIGTLFDIAQTEEIETQETQVGA